MRGPHPLLGKAAPSFRAEMLDGTPVDLSEHLGKEVIVLDFWATWCPPCRKGLPIVAGLSKDYADRGVRVFAINQEPAATVRAYLEGAGLDLPVVLDKSGSAGTLYGVTLIPQTFLIGKDGVVQEAHTGVPWGYDASLRRSLERLLSGESLIEKEH